MNAGKLDKAGVLVVGGAGFVGSNLVRYLLDLGVGRIEIVDNFLSSERENVLSDRRVKLIEGSIADDKILRRLEDRYDYIFHLATYHGNQSSIADPLADHENNLLTTLKLFDWIKDFKRLKKVVYSSAGCSVAEKTQGEPKPTIEEAPISLYLKQHGLPIVKARFQNVYGPGEILGAGKWRGTPATVWRNVIPTFVYKALNGESLPVHGKGEATRDFIYVEDVVRGLWLGATRGESGEVYNLASGKEVGIGRLAKFINQLVGSSAGVKFLPGRSWDQSIRRFGSTSKARQELGFIAEVGMEEGLKKTIKWTRENWGLIERCMRKHERMMKSGKDL
jgi:nucleoside-diphosphate-sugar epimerase